MVCRNGGDTFYKYPSNDTIKYYTNSFVQRVINESTRITCIAKDRKRM